VPQLVTDGTIRCDCTNCSQPLTTTLTADVSSTATTLPVASGTNIVTGTYIQLNAGVSGALETVLVTAGGGTSTLTVTRGQLGTTAVTHYNGTTVVVPGSLVVQLLSVPTVLNQNLIITKIDSTINYVKILAYSGDTFPGGSTSLLLIDSTAANGTWAARATT